MEEPLGYSVGNNLEVIEAIKFLNGNMPEDLKDVVLELGAYMIKLAGLGDNIEDNKKKMLENINNGKAFNKFLELIKNQGGDISYIENVEKFDKAKYILPIYATDDGYISQINAKEVGKLACDLGAGRIKKDDKIDYSVGIILNKKVSNKVIKDEILGYVHANDEEKGNNTAKKLKDIIKIDQEESKKLETIIKVIQ